MLQSPQEDPVYLSRLALTNYRNFTELELGLPTGCEGCVI